VFFLAGMITNRMRVRINLNINIKIMGRQNMYKAIFLEKKKRDLFLGIKLPIKNLLSKQQIKKHIITGMSLIKLIICKYDFI
jgi:hypothetical protein